MKGVRDWVFSQLLFKSLASSGPLSSCADLYDEGHQGEDYFDQGSTPDYACLFRITEN